MSRAFPTKIATTSTDVEAVRVLAASRGRAGRGTYWIGMLHSFIGTQIMSSAMRLGDGPNPLLGLSSLLVVWVWVSATTRRMHDFSVPPLWGWAALIGVFLFVNAVVADIFIASLAFSLPFFALGIVPGDPGRNRYGMPTAWPPKVRHRPTAPAPLAEDEVAAH